MRFAIRHETRYVYEGVAFGATIRLRLLPVDAATQRVESWLVSVNGEPVSNFTANSFGVPECVWRTGSRIGEAVIVAEGVVETSDRAGVVGQPDEAAHPRVFLRAGDYTQPDAAIVALAEQARSPDGPLASLHALCRLVHEALTYRADTTSSTTTAAQALAQRLGVCQDFAHVFIAAARAMDIPARYVAGYVHDGEAGGTLQESHGWAEAHVGGLGWIGFDPTRKLCVTSDYVRLSWGLDAFDAAPLRGVAGLDGTIFMAVDVAISETPPPAQSQSQQQ